MGSRCRAHASDYCTEKRGALFLSSFSRPVEGRPSEGAKEEGYGESFTLDCEDEPEEEKERKEWPK